MIETNLFQVVDVQRFVLACFFPSFLLPRHVRHTHCTNSNDHGQHCNYRQLETWKMKICNLVCCHYYFTALCCLLFAGCCLNPLDLVPDQHISSRYKDSTVKPALEGHPRGKIYSVRLIKFSASIRCFYCFVLSNPPLVLTALFHAHALI